MTNFLHEKYKYSQNICEKSIKSFLYISCEQIRTNKIESICFKGHDGQFLDPSIFSSLYIPIQIEKFMKSAPHSNANNFFWNKIYFYFFRF